MRERIRENLTVLAGRNNSRRGESREVSAADVQKERVDIPENLVYSSLRGGIYGINL